MDSKVKISNMTKLSNSERHKLRGRKISQEEIKNKENEMDLDDLEQEFKYNGFRIKTMGDLRNLVKTFTKTIEIEKLEDLICDEDYYYIFNWYLKYSLLKKNIDSNI